MHTPSSRRIRSRRTCWRSRHTTLRARARTSKAVLQRFMRSGSQGCGSGIPGHCERCSRPSVQESERDSGTAPRSLGGTSPSTSHIEEAPSGLLVRSKRRERHSPVSSVRGQRSSASPSSTSPDGPGMRGPDPRMPYAHFAGEETPCGKHAFSTTVAPRWPTSATPSRRAEISSAHATCIRNSVLRPLLPMLGSSSPGSGSLRATCWIAWTSSWQSSLASYRTGRLAGSS